MTFEFLHIRLNMSCVKKLKKLKKGLLIILSDLM